MDELSKGNNTAYGKVTNDSHKELFLIRKFTGILTCFYFLFIAGDKTVCANKSIDFEFAADFYSKYIWRGQNVNDESVFQPSVSLSKWGFTASIWGNFDLTNTNDNLGEFSELDYTIDYSAAVPGVEGLNFSVGAIYYQFPNTSFEPTTEIYGGLSLEMPLLPSVRIYRDVDEIDGSYVQLGIGHTFEKLVIWSDECYCGLQLGGSVGYGSAQYNEGYFGAKGGKFNDLTISAGFPVCIGQRWIVKPSINYSMMLSDKIRVATADSDNLWAGVGILTRF